jgi:pimeloyl-ACP methyl ester carboxylesterase
MDALIGERLWGGVSSRASSVLRMMGEYLANATHAELVVYPGEGHMLFLTHWQEILEALTRSE